MRLPRAALALLSALLLAGCNSGDGDPGPTGGEADPTGAPTDSEDAGEAPDASEGFAVLVAAGRLEGEGPSPGSVTACSIAAPDGLVDVGSATAWARPGGHSFEAGKTWLLVVDEVEVDDPRSTGCGVRTVTPFTATGHWQPQVGDGAFSLDVAWDGERLLVGRNAVEPGGRFETYAEFEEGGYTFSGDLAFTHAGWWPASSFAERDEEVPAGDDAAWWD